ncbi:MAG: hypothetical protein LBB50_02515 [Oscillospiraceae bacterium]|jgi:hypothetical protein|nr:hypothetical protein [Oscillospiraceae bacterium]
MNTRKLLAVLLCVATVFSVMTAVAYAAQSAETAPVVYAPPSQEATTTPPPETTKSFIENLDTWWNGGFPEVDTVLWNSGFRTVVDFLVAGFQFLLKIVGFDAWGGGILNGG